MATAKRADKERARALRASGWTMGEIAEEVGVSKSSVSLWTTDVEFDDAAWLERVAIRRTPASMSRRRSRLALRRVQQIEEANRSGKERIGRLTEKEFLVAGLALYAGEGSKSDGKVALANTNPAMLLFFVRWLRHFFAIDESRLRLRLYLHEGLDLEAANAFWSDLTGIPTSQFGKPYRAVADPTIRRSKHVMGCPAVSYNCAPTHRRIMGMMTALLGSGAFPG
jgi:transcriptional regulator with XRE-family HTH domain